MFENAREEGARRPHFRLGGEAFEAGDPGVAGDSGGDIVSDRGGLFMAPSVTDIRSRGISDRMTNLLIGTVAAVENGD